MKKPNSFVILLKDLTSRPLNRIVSLLYLLIAVVCIVFGNTIFSSSEIYGNTANYLVTLMPAKTMAILGAIGFSIITITTMHRDKQSGSNTLIDSVLPPLKNNIATTASILLIGIFTCTVSFVVTLPISIFKLSYVFDFFTYSIAWLGIALPAICFSILLSAGIYHIFKRMDASLTSVLALMIFSLLTGYGNYLFPWVQTSTYTFSDVTGNEITAKLILYNRLFWLLISVSAHTAGLLFTRVYGKGALRSAAYHTKKVVLPAILLASIVASGVCFVLEPNFDNSIPADFNVVTGDNGAAIVTTNGAENNNFDENPFIQEGEDEVFTGVEEGGAVPGVDEDISDHGGFTGGYFGPDGPITESEPQNNSDADGGGMVGGFLGADGPISESEGVPNSAVLVDTQIYDAVFSSSDGTLSGKAEYVLFNPSNKGETIKIQVNPGINITSLKLNGDEIPYSEVEEQEMKAKTYTFLLPSGENLNLVAEYSGTLENDKQSGFISNLGIGAKYINAPLMPTLSIPSEGMCSGSFKMSGNLTPIIENASLQKTSDNDGQGYATWEFQTMGSVRSVTAAEYSVEKFEAGGIPIEFYYFEKHKDVISETNAVDTIKKAVDFFTGLYGALPYDENMPLIIFEQDALLMGGLAGGNTCAIGETIFAPKGFSPSADNPRLEGSSGLEVLVHEIAHQWWGVNVQMMPETDMPWSAEELACYSTYLFVKEFYGADYAKRQYVDMWMNVHTKNQNSFYMTQPEYMQRLTDDEIAQIYMNFAFENMYSSMPLMLHQAEKAVGGEKAFKDALSSIYQKYMFNLLSSDDFANELGISKEDMQIGHS